MIDFTDILLVYLSAVIKISHFNRTL